MRHITGVVLTDEEVALLAVAILKADQYLRPRGASLNSSAVRLAADLAADTGSTAALPTGDDDAVTHDEIDSAEAARILGCSIRNITDLASRGRLPGHRHGGRWTFSRDDILVHKHYRT